jgi:predicted acyl esterase
MKMGAELSQPKYSVVAAKNVMVKMRDGVAVAVDIYRPAAEGKFPALLSVSPLGKDAQSLDLPPGYGMNGEWPHIEAGHTEFWVSRGYIHAIADARGTGRSEGEFDFWFSQNEQTDGYDLVEWLASESWCDGNVGMLGISWFAIIQYLTAALQPPHLKAIFPHDGWGDLYRDICYHGGIFTCGWAPHLRSRTYAHTMVSASRRQHRPEELANLVAEASRRGSVDKSPYLAETLIVPEHDPATFDLLLHPLDGPFYQERSAYTKWANIKVPTYLGSEMHNAYTTAMHLPGAFSAWEGITAPKKLAIREYVGGVERPFRAFHDEILRWYDHWLKGIDTGLMDEPPIKIWVRNADEWRYETEWPPTGTQWSKYHLRDQRRLLRESGPAAGEAPDVLSYTPVMPNVGSGVPLDPFRPESLSYEIRFDRETLFVGPVAFYFYASLSAEDADWIVKLKHVRGDGSEEIISRGWLKASHRELDPERSKPWQPYHPHTRAVPVPVGAIEQYAVDIRPIATLFRAGEGLKLEIWGCDCPPADPEEMDWTLMYPMLAHLPNAVSTEQTIYHDESHESFLLLPEAAK